MNAAFAGSADLKKERAHVFAKLRATGTPASDRPSDEELLQNMHAMAAMLSRPVS